MWSDSICFFALCPPCPLWRSSFFGFQLTVEGWQSDMVQVDRPARYISSSVFSVPSVEIPLFPLLTFNRLAQPFMPLVLAQLRELASFVVKAREIAIHFIEHAFQARHAAVIRRCGNEMRIRQRA